MDIWSPYAKEQTLKMDWLWNLDEDQFFFCISYKIILSEK